MTRTLGRYKLIEKLGWGGMGEVWRAQHTTLGRDAAVKLIRAGVLSTKSDAQAENILRRFAREAPAPERDRSRTRSRLTRGHKLLDHFDHLRIASTGPATPARRAQSGNAARSRTAWSPGR